MAEQSGTFAGVNAVDMAFKALGWIRPPAGFRVPETISQPAEQEVGEVGDLEYERTSALGTPVILPITINELALPDNTIISVTGRNKIIETDLNSKRGSFKELWAKEDYRVTLRGMVVQNDGTENPPDEQLRAIKQLLDEEAHLPIECDLTTLFDISDVAIYDYKFPPVKGMPMVRAFELMLKSDSTYDLELDTNGNPL